MDLKSKIILIYGPTASGKSQFAVKLAKKINGEIINADSMQVYKELKIISARPSQKDYQNIITKIKMRRLDKNPDEMDILRPNAKEHLTFGQGIHFCLGAQLARTELEIALSQMLARTESWVLSQNKNSLKHHPNVLLRGLKELHINFSAR